MVYKKLQDLVNTALNDNEITAEEEARLMARAREMGQDLDEFKSYLEGKKKDGARRKAHEQEYENRLAHVKLGDKIALYESLYSNIEHLKSAITKELGEVVIPNDPEGLFQLSNFLFAKYSDGKFKDLYKARLTECINKGVFSFPSDERFKSLETAFKQKELNRLKAVGILAGSLVLIILIIIIIANVL